VRALGCELEGMSCVQGLRGLLSPVSTASCGCGAQAGGPSLKLQLCSGLPEAVGTGEGEREGQVWTDERLGYEWGGIYPYMGCVLCAVRCHLL
jgi:hypothetical protein